MRQGTSNTRPAASEIVSTGIGDHCGARGAPGGPPGALQVLVVAIWVKLVRPAPWQRSTR